jgi:hypothetical protein
MQRWTIINIVLVVLAAVLVFSIWSTWARALPEVDTTPRPVAPPAGAGPRERGGKRGAADKNAAHQQQTPAALVSEIAEKDLFDPSRRPQPPEEVRVPEVVPVVGPPPGVAVVGVRIFGRDREVFFTDAAQGNQQRRLRSGDQIGGYTVKEVRPTEVVLNSPSGDEVVMPLQLEKKGGAGARPAVRGGQPVASPAAGVATASPAAGVAVKPPPPPVPPPPGVPGVPGMPGGIAQPAVPVVPPNPQLQQLPADVRQKLEQLKQREGTTRQGHKQR